MLFLQLLCDVLRHTQAWNDNDNEILNDSLQSSSSSSGERGCCKVGRNNFPLVFMATVSHGRRDHICRRNEWLSQWVMVTIEFRSWSSFYPMFTWNTIEDSKHLTMISGSALKNKAFLYRNISQHVIEASWKLREKTFFPLKGEYIIVWICELCPIDPKIYLFPFLPWHYRRR